MKHLFVYGTLQNDEIVKALTRKTFKKIPYTLDGYSIHQVKGEHFPGMIPSKDVSTEGFVLYDVDEKSYNKILIWEGDDYKPVDVKIVLVNAEIVASTYIWKHRSLLVGKWSNNNYRLGHMNQCIKECIPKIYQDNKNNVLT